MFFLDNKERKTIIIFNLIKKKKKKKEMMQSFDELPPPEVTASPLVAFDEVKKKGRFGRLAHRMRTISLSFVTSVLTVLSLILAAVCISVISETLYHKTLSAFAQAALTSVVSRVVFDTTNSLTNIEHAIDAVVFSTTQNQRAVPTVEDELLARTGLITPLGPSVVNVSTGDFSYNKDCAIPNSTLRVSTWRNHYGSLLSSLKLSSRMYFSAYDILFNDGSYLRMETNVQVGDPYFGVVGSKAVLFDGILQNDTTTNQSSYFVRRTPLTNGFELLFDKSRIIPPITTDRRLEPWFQTFIPDSTPRYDVSSRFWLGVNYNITTGAAWVDLAARLDTKAGMIGKTRISYNIDALGWLPRSYWRWIPMDDVEVFTISHTDDLIIGAEQFTRDPQTSLHRAVVAVGYVLTPEEKSINCALTPNDDLVTLTKTCRHTVHTYGHRPLQVAREMMRNMFSDIDFRIVDTSDTSLYTGRTYMSLLPTYRSFKCDNRNYFVSWAPVSTTTVGGGLQWVTLAIVPEEEVTGVLTDVRKLVIGVTAAIVVFLAIVFAVGTRMVLSPISEIAELLTAAAYLYDSVSEAGESFTDLSAHDAKKITQKVSRLNERRLSRWAEVRAIQKSYWAMADELQTLKAYIPVHLRDEITTSKKQPESGEGASQEGPVRSSRAPSATPSSRGRATPFDTASIQMGPTSPAASNALVVELDPADEIPSPIDDVDRGETLVPEQEANSPLLASELKIAVVNKQEEEEPYHPIFFADSCLVDRDITVVHLNFISFHNYARRRHPTTISSDYAEFITYINGEVKRFGGVLESFFGDKLWFSFNATSKCVRHQVAACYFAYHVTSVVNGAALRYQDALPTEAPADGSKARMPVIDKRFAVCVNGINCGVSTGRAFVGPLGNNIIKRHNIISNAISEAVALERQTLHYTGCNVFVSSDMLPHIEGYCQYMLLDATLLPGSQGKRRLIACIMGPMLGPMAEMDVVRRWLTKKDHSEAGTLSLPSFVHTVENPFVSPSPLTAKFPEPQWVDRTVPSVNRFAAVNEGFRAILRGNASEANQWLQEMRQGIRAPDESSMETVDEFEERKAMTSLMILLIETIMTKGVDARRYTSTLGDAYIPRAH